MMCPFSLSGVSSANAQDFELLLAPHLPALYRTAYRYTGSRQDAEDLVQDILIKLFPRVDELRAVDSLQPWLMRVLYRQFVDGLRRQSRTAGDSRRDRAAEGPPDPDTLAHPSACPEDYVERELAWARVGEALDQLNPEQRALIVLHDMEGHVLESLTEVLDAPLGTLKSRLHRARAKLRGHLGLEPFVPAERVTGTETAEVDNNERLSRTDQTAG